MATTVNATLKASVSFTRYNAGTYAGIWTIVGRKGRVRPKIESEPRHGRSAWAVSFADRTIEHGEVRTVYVDVPWRLSNQPLEAEEIARIMRIAADHVGEFTVID